MVRILLTNDDGIHSDGLTKLEAALREVGDVYTIAPASEMSGASHSLTLSRPLRIRRIDERHWTVDGTPTDCVTLALHRILGDEERPHLRVSGINHGGNLGDDASYSGTVAGAPKRPSSAYRASPSVSSRARTSTSRRQRVLPSSPCVIR